MKLLILTFLALNVIAFLAIGNDKKRAQNNQSRISEKTLLLLAFLGGTIGSGLGMLYFSHKTSKNSYLFKFWALVFVQCLVLFGAGYYIIKR